MHKPVSRNELPLAVEGIEGQIGFLNQSGGEFWETMAAPAVEVPAAVRLGRLSCCSPEPLPPRPSGDRQPASAPPGTESHSILLFPFPRERKVGR